MMFSKVIQVRPETRTDSDSVCIGGEFSNISSRVENLKTIEQKQQIERIYRPELGLILSGIRVGVSTDHWLSFDVKRGKNAQTGEEKYWEVFEYWFSHRSR